MSKYNYVKLDDETSTTKGQVIVVDEVDNNGKPTRWKAVDSSTLITQWSGKTWLSYGDSITDIKNYPYQSVVTEKLGFSNHYGRGISGQTFVYNERVWFANKDGSCNSYKNDASMKNPSSYENAIPNGCTAHYGYFASWDRITTMIPENIKDKIDVIVVFGVNDAKNINSDEFIAPAFSSDNILDSDWKNATENELKGDFDLNTFIGAVASTIMKLQARCPQAMIVLGTSWSGVGDGSPMNSNNAVYGNNGKAWLKEGELIKKIANYYSIPCIDIWGNSLVNPFNRSKYTTDGVHPNTEEGKKALGRVVAEGLMNIMPKI